FCNAANNYSHPIYIYRIDSDFVAMGQSIIDGFVNDFAVDNNNLYVVNTSLYRLEKYDYLITPFNITLSSFIDKPANIANFFYVGLNFKYAFVSDQVSIVYIINISTMQIIGELVFSDPPAGFFIYGGQIFIKATINGNTPQIVYYFGLVNTLQIDSAFRILNNSRLLSHHGLN
ncbi:MAG: hypothetical protein ACYC0J_09580, partial [Gammaproteobacteria bacterium]